MRLDTKGLVANFVFDSCSNSSPDMEMVDRKKGLTYALLGRKGYDPLLDSDTQLPRPTFREEL